MLIKQLPLATKWVKRVGNLLDTLERIKALDPYHGEVWRMKMVAFYARRIRGELKERPPLVDVVARLYAERLRIILGE